MFGFAEDKNFAPKQDESECPMTFITGQSLLSSFRAKVLLIMTLSWHHIGKANMVNDEKEYLKNQAPLCIIYLER